NTQLNGRWQVLRDEEVLQPEIHTEIEERGGVDAIPLNEDFVLARDGRVMYKTQLQWALERELRDKLGVPESWETDTKKILWHKEQLARLEKADAAPRCEHIYSDGTRCQAPKLKTGHWCYAHERMKSVRPKKLNLLPTEDANSIMLNLGDIARALIQDEISEKKAGLLMYNQQLGLIALSRVTFKETDGRLMVREAPEDLPQRTQRNSSLVIDGDSGDGGAPPMSVNPMAVWPVSVGGEASPVAAEERAQSRAPQPRDAPNRHVAGIPVPVPHEQNVNSGLSPHRTKSACYEDPGVPPHRTESVCDEDPGVPPHRTKSACDEDPGVELAKSNRFGVEVGGEGRHRRHRHDREIQKLSARGATFYGGVARLGGVKRMGYWPASCDLPSMFLTRATRSSGFPLRRNESTNGFISTGISCMLETRTMGILRNFSRSSWATCCELRTLLRR
ncbi:MAG TPA: hypothetical protein VFW31_15225, partial [Candidatus Angelobacter sp.]|nr:hypothetical protein [Candidatus Angelobacter sp.]